MVQGLTAEAILGSAAATAGDVDNNDNSARIQNQIKYISPMMAGLQFEAMYALGGITGSPGQAGTYSAAVAYTGGPLSLAGGYFHASNTNAATIGGKRTTWSGTTDSLFDGVVSNGYQTASGFGIAQVAGKYKFGNLSVGAGYSNVQFKSDAQSTFVSTEKFNTGRAFVQYQFTPVASGLIGYSFTKATGDTSATYHQVSFGGTYALSKRTDFYTVLAYQHASGTQRTTSGGTQKAVASIGSYGISGTDTQTMVLLGIRHRF
jgi:predicted porin